MEKRTLKPGEKTFIYLLVGLSLFILYSSYNISGFVIVSEPFAPGAFPLITSLVLILLAFNMWRETMSKSFSSHEYCSILDSLKATRKLLISYEIIVMIVLLLLYTYFLTRIGFIYSSAIFIWLSIESVQFLSGKHKDNMKLLTLIKSAIYNLIISAFSITIIVLIFSNIFRVRLP